MGRIITIIVVPLLLGGAAFFGYTAYHKLNMVKPGATFEQKRQATVSASSTDPIPYQPEAQMMTQSKQVQGEHEQEEANGEAIARQAEKNDTGATSTYTYDSSTCRNSSTSAYLCFSSYYRTLVQNYGADVAFADIKKRFNENGDIVSLCHPFMHVIGNAAATNYKTVSEAYLHGDSFCWSGYYHGILEGVIARIGIANLPANINTICADIPGKETYNFDYYNCVHGLGHGIMESLGDEVFKSLAMCDNVNGRWEQESCYSGVFMENIIVNTNLGGANKASEFLKPSEPLYPCTAVEDKYKGQCYLGQTSYALEVNNYNFSKTVPLCTTVAQPYRDICFQSIGRDAANQALHDADRTKITCALASDANDRMNCMVGAVKEFVSYYHGVKEAHAYCNILDDAERTNCNATADDYFRVF
jgi:hypothetical protein